MTDPRPLPLFYKNPVPLDSKKHAKSGLKANFGLSFTSSVNAVPINIVEFPQVCHTYPIAFSPDSAATPVAIMGIRNSENLFTTPKGEWVDDMAYIPAYIRRYPFIFSEVPGMDKFSLCIDETPETIDQNKEQAFFEKNGEPTALTNNALEFCKSYHAAAQQTLSFCKAINDAGILVEREAQIQSADGKRMSFSGFRIIDEIKLSQLDAETFLDWRRKGWIAFIYAHLFSGAQWQRITRMLSDRIKREAA